jgi:hypothetical protein
MLRRTILDEAPMSELALWSSRLGWFSIAVAALSIFIVRSGVLEVVPALTTFIAAIGCAGLAILFALGAFVSIWRQGYRGLGRALLGLFIGLTIVAYPAYQAYRATKLPAIGDITTDFVNPPRFDVLARLRPRGTSDYPGEKAAALQRAAYPEVVPLQEDMPPKGVYDIVLKLIAKHKWLVVDARAPLGPRGTGTIEAVARTTLFGFREDVAIRVAPAGGGSRVDIRSASRYAFNDFGANARRVRALLDEIDDAVSAAPERRVEPEKPEPKSAPRRPASSTRR